MTVSAISIFISYSRTDSTFVDRLEADLQARNFRTWVDRRKLEGGQVWLDELEKAIERSHIMLVVLSPEAVKSKYVRMEYRFAQGLGKLVIPLEYQHCPRVPIDLNSLQWVDFERSYDRGLGDLLIALSPIRAVDLTIPQPPLQAKQPAFSMTQTEPALVQPQPAPPRPEPGLLDLYRAGIMARAVNDLERTVVLWQQILERDPQFQSGTLATQMQKLQEELYPLRVQRLRDRAIQAHAMGAWSQEIGALQAMLALEPNESEAKIRLALATWHLRYVWMYESAVQFVVEQAFDAARIQLQMLWQEDPYYGDPAGLSQRIGIELPQPPPLQGAYIGIVRVEEGKEPGRVYEIRKESFSIGRSPDSDIFLEDLAVSKQHASIIYQGNGSYALIDEGSANGTKVNGQTINKFQPYPIYEGSKIQLGQTVLVLGNKLFPRYYPPVCPRCSFDNSIEISFCANCGLRF